MQTGSVGFSLDLSSLVPRPLPVFNVARGQGTRLLGMRASEFLLWAGQVAVTTIAANESQIKRTMSEHDPKGQSVTNHKVSQPLELNFIHLINITGEKIQEFHAHQGCISSCSLIHNNSTIVTASHDTKIILWVSPQIIAIGKGIHNLWLASPMALRNAMNIFISGLDVLLVDVSQSVTIAILYTKRVAHPSIIVSWSQTLTQEERV